MVSDVFRLFEQLFSRDIQGILFELLELEIAAFKALLSFLVTRGTTFFFYAVFFLLNE